MLDFTFGLYKQEMIETLKNFIKIESVKSASQPNMPYGKGIFDALMYLQSTSERMDLECVNLYGQMGYVDYGYGDNMLAVLTHIDVVPKGDGWTMPPFEGIEKDGKIYGRGAIDNKGPAIAALYALRALKDNCVQLNKKVRLIFGTDEESGWGDIDFYKQHEPLPDIAFSPDGEYPVINTEKGLLHAELILNYCSSDEDGVCVKSFSAGTRPNIVPNKAECIISAPFSTIQYSIQTYKCPIGATLACKETPDGLIHITSMGKSAHGSRPENGVNAAASLLQYLSTLPLSSGRLEKAVYTLAARIGANINGQGVELDIFDEISGMLTFNLGTLFAGDGVLKACIDIRYPISYTREFISEKLEKHFSEFNIRYMHSLDPHHIPEDSVLIKTLKEAYTEITGDEAYCVAIGGATYARAFENAVTFGPLFPGKPSVEHGPDEYIEIDALIKNAEIIANAIIKLCG
ncbi:MAG: dipeptidase PepV [Christensenellales bacterium]|jgi:succinyl-diaminopimelate desuccinylase